MPGKGKRMVSNDDFFTKVSEAKDIIHHAALVAWKIALALAEVDDRIKQAAEFMVKVAQKYPQYLLVPEETYVVFFLVW